MTEAWQEILMYTVKNRKRGGEKLAIYPFGHNGLCIKRFLNDILGVMEDLRIDNYYSQFTDYVIAVDTLNKIDGYQEYVFIISTTIHNFAQELLMRGVSEKNIVFCYPEYDVYTNAFSAYHDAVWSLIRQFKPKSIFDIDLLWGKNIGKSLYSGIEHREILLEEIDLYADKDKVSQLFPAQQKIYNVNKNNYTDMILCIDNFDIIKKKIVENMEHKIIAIVSKVPIDELTESEKCMYSYLYIYFFGEMLFR